MVHNLCCTDTWVGITGEHEAGTCKVHAATCLALSFETAVDISWINPEHVHDTYLWLSS